MILYLISFVGTYTKLVYQVCAVWWGTNWLGGSLPVKHSHNDNKHLILFIKYVRYQKYSLCIKICLLLFVNKMFMGYFINCRLRLFPGFLVYVNKFYSVLQRGVKCHFVFMRPALPHSFNTVLRYFFNVWFLVPHIWQDYLQLKYQKMFFIKSCFIV